MNDRSFSDATLNEAVQRLSWVVEAFAEELHGKPTFEEFLEILGSSVPPNSEFIEAVPFPLRFKATTRGDRRYEGTPSTRVAELNDNTFGEAADFLAFLLAQFPTEPEIYHGPDPVLPGLRLGEFGAAESPNGAMRQISEEEAREVGLLDNTYEQVYMSEHLHQLLNENRFD